MSTNVTPDGRAPLSVSEGVGTPVAVTVNVPAEPTANDVLFALVMTGAWFTVSEKACEASVPTPLCALIVSG